MTRLLLFAVLLSAGCATTTKQAVYSSNPGWSVDGPDVVCPVGQTCQIWKVTFNARKFAADGYQCVPGPDGLGAGRLLAVSPNDPQVVAVELVELGGGCYAGSSSGEIIPTFRGGDVIR